MNCTPEGYTISLARELLDHAMRQVKAANNYNRKGFDTKTRHLACNLILSATHTRLGAVILLAAAEQHTPIPKTLEQQLSHLQAYTAAQAESLFDDQLRDV